MHEKKVRVGSLMELPQEISQSYTKSVYLPIRSLTNLTDTFIEIFSLQDWGSWSGWSMWHRRVDWICPVVD
jgi:hypothetical protein